MDQIASALGDAARWRIVELLAERPRSVGELAELTGLRQPQTTKHLKTLARAELVTVFPLGQRRVYALETGPLSALEQRLRELVAAAGAHTDERAVIARYRTAIESEAALAQQDRWADGRTFTFERTLAASRDAVWRHWTDASLLASWWAPEPMQVTECAIEPKPRGRVVLDYRDAEGHRYRSEGLVHTATEPQRLTFDLSVLDSAGTVAFTGHYDLALEPDPEGTRLRLGLRISHTTVDAVAYIAGIESGWATVLDNLADIVGAAAHPTDPVPDDNKKEARQ
ncbi:metalloregulator ArsR/SmtB family transcription factor [Nocardia cyriacigeorgica]|uniref:metalloregulator ArsR/SmtB family transcription factor n=1 Tax=Nocardia cyriacigeorgica TaxID=135487 RepID=UPI002453E702|nr:metalloregulator ArsR/SmtB family transcription factor [Nocardia cyriacigeorgica]